MSPMHQLTCIICTKPKRYTLSLIEHVSPTHNVLHDSMHFCEEHAPTTAVVANTSVGLIEVFGTQGDV